LMLEAIPTPGHSSDHLAFYEHSTASLFSGDSAGIVLPNYQYLGPVTPPPAFDVEAQRATFQRLLSLPIVHLLFSHWGPAREPAEVILGRLQASFEHFDQLMRERVEHGQVDEDAIIAAMVPDHSVPAAGQWVIAGWIRMSVQGLQRYYQKREAG
jgi:glyoxylase-like metal-dependent hydrolase (beta-lactamase superfamily II)